VGVLKIVCLAVMLFRNMMMKLMKSILERVRPQTKADIEL
jgi:hypothetical protein